MVIKIGTVSPLYAYMPRERIVDEVLHKFDDAECRYCLIEGDSETDNLVIFTPEATHELINLFYWGKRHPLNVFEQQAGLVGHFFAESKEQNRTYTLVVSHILPAHCSERTPIGARLRKENAADMLDEIRILNQNRGRSEFDIPAFKEEYILLGIVHSHPNGLDVFMSGTDHDTHMRNNSSDASYNLSMIVNPHRKLMLAYGGKAIIETPVQLMVRQEDFEILRGPTMLLCNLLYPSRNPEQPEQESEQEEQSHSQELDFGFLQEGCTGNSAAVPEAETVMQEEAQPEEEPAPKEDVHTENPVPDSMGTANEGENAQIHIPSVHPIRQKEKTASVNPIQTESARWTQSDWGFTSPITEAVAESFRNLVNFFFHF